MYTGTCVPNADTRPRGYFLPHVFKLNHVTPSWSLYNGNDDGKREPWTPSFIAARSRESTMILRVAWRCTLFGCRDNLQDSATTFATNSFRKLYAKLRISLIIIEINVAIINREITLWESMVFWGDSKQITWLMHSIINAICRSNDTRKRSLPRAKKLICPRDHFVIPSDLLSLSRLVSFFFSTWA